MALYKVLCDELVGCLCVRQDRTSMLLWVLDDRGYNRKICTISEGLVAANNYLMSLWNLTCEQGSLELVVM